MKYKPGKGGNSHEHVLSILLQRMAGRKAGPIESGCHRDGAWQIRQLSSSDSHDHAGYQQAGSANPVTLQAAQDMMAGNPLDAAEEKAARDKGWK